MEHYSCRLLKQAPQTRLQSLRQLRRTPTRQSQCRRPSHRSAVDLASLVIAAPVHRPDRSAGPTKSALVRLHWTRSTVAVMRPRRSDRIRAVHATEWPLSLLRRRPESGLYVWLVASIGGREADGVRHELGRSIHNIPARHCAGASPQQRRLLNDNNDDSAISQNANKERETLRRCTRTSVWRFQTNNDGFVLCS